MNIQCSFDLTADFNSEGKRTSCERCIAIKKGCGTAEKGSERVKRRKKTEDDAKGKGKEKETEVESEEVEEEETVSERPGRMETIMKGMVKKQEELIAQQRWLKWRVEMIWRDTDDLHDGMDGLYRVGESEESDESGEHDWLAEIGELGAEQIEAMQKGVGAEHE